MKQQPTLSTPNNQSQIMHEQAHRDDVDAFRQQRIQHGHEDWQTMIDAWQKDDESACRLWFMYAANYLACTGSVRWAIDPLRTVCRNPNAKDVDVTPLESLQFVLLTHNHSDHVDTVLWARLKDAPIRWLVPSFMRDLFVKTTGIEDERLTVMTPGQVVECGEVRIEAFEGLHWGVTPGKNGGEDVKTGIDAMGYQVQWREKTLLFPCDMRTYDAGKLASMQSPDVLFSHVWLGRGAAGEMNPPLLEEYLAFIVAMSPRERVVLGHLYETARTAPECWTAYHAKLIVQEISKRLPSVKVDWPLRGEVIEL